jgi:hypothetical protein
VDQKNDRQRAGNFRAAILGLQLDSTGGSRRRDPLATVLGHGAETVEDPLLNRAAFDRKSVGFHAENANQF